MSFSHSFVVVSLLFIFLIKKSRAGEEKKNAVSKHIRTFLFINRFENTGN